MALRGQYEHSLDSKDRLTVPARFRADLAGGVVLSAGLDPCVDVWPREGYESFTRRFVDQLNPLGRQARMMRRRFHATASDEELDSAGRVRLPRHLIEHAGLEGNCVIVGVDDHLEIWSPDAWSEHELQIGDEAAGIAEELAGAAEGGSG